jgi:hypothetical protein
MYLLVQLEYDDDLYGFHLNENEKENELLFRIQITI